MTKVCTIHRARGAGISIGACLILAAGLLGLPTSAASAAPSGALSFARIEGYWIAAGGPASEAATAAAITGAESSFYPGNIQPGEPYSVTGWGLWQITSGDTVSQFCTDFRMLDPWNNAEAAVYKYRRAGNTFAKDWTTYTNGTYRQFLPPNPPAPKIASDPGEYVQVHSAPAGTHNSASPGTGCGPRQSSPGYAFWKGTNGDLYQAQGPADGGLTGPIDRGMGPMGSEPSVGIDSDGATYVYWKGTNGNLIEGFWNGSSWVGPYNRGMGTLGSAPTVAVSPSGTAYVFWEGTNGHLYDAQGPADGTLTGPIDRGMGPMGSKPSAGIDSDGATYVYWKGTNGNLIEGFWNGSSWVGPYNRGMGTLGSAPTVAVTGSGTAYVFWKGTNGDLYQAHGPANGTLTGPIDRGMGPMGSGPSAAVDSLGATYVYWQGTNSNLIEGFWNGSSWVGPSNRGMGILGSQPTVTIFN